jgi:hypothetical protein
MIGLPPICIHCRRLDRQGDDQFACTAFPGGIPEAIIMSTVDHRKPVDGDHGLQFDLAPGHQAGLDELLNLIHFPVNTTGQK